MRADMTDKEQIDMIKKWWNDYGKTLAIAIIIGLALGFGWRYWKSYTIKKAEQASSLFEHVMTASSNKDYKSADEYAQQLESNYKRTVYASMAALIQASDAVKQNKLNEALSKLQWVIANAKVDSIKQTARLRAARILLAQNKTADALTLIQTIDDKAFQPSIEIVKGDIYSKIGNKEKAQLAYQAANTALKATGGQDPVLQMKIAK